MGKTGSVTVSASQPSRENLLLWVCPNGPKPQCGYSKPCDPVWWQDPVLGRHCAVDCCLACSTHPSPASPVLCPFPSKGEIPFLWEFPLCWYDMPALAGTAWSRLTFCKPCVEASFPEPVPRKWLIPGDPLSASRRKLACPTGGSLFLRKPASAGWWACHPGVPAPHASWLRLSCPCACMPLVRKEGEAHHNRRRLGIDLKIMLGLNWKASRV